MRIYNSLSREIENFSPIGKEIGVYTCGPTVHHFVTIGNWRTYTLSDLVVRLLRFQGYKVKYVMNITDVGHLTGDNLGDADTGDDRMEKAVVREGKNAWEIAEFYTSDFMAGFEALNLVKPDVFAKATDHIPQQIEMVKTLVRKGFTYEIAEDGIYFDTKVYEKVIGKYGELSTLDQVMAGARVEHNPLKKNPRDFALWKFSPKGVKRQMEWDSPWGVGFPGWHIECSAMSVEYLGNQFDIHIGGEDLRSTHHPNEIAQAQAATGRKPFVKYWIHGAFLLIDGGRMGKSLGNAFTLHDLVKQEIDPLALRYFYLTGHYRKQLNFTWNALEGSLVALNRLRAAVARLKEESSKTKETSYRRAVHEYRMKFVTTITEDLNFAKGLPVVWEVIKDTSLSARDRLEILVDFDKVLGFDLAQVKLEARPEVPEKIMKLVEERENLRIAGKWTQADQVREQIEKLGWVVKDRPGGSDVSKR